MEEHLEAEDTDGVEEMTEGEMGVVENTTAVVIVTVCVTLTAEDFVIESKSHGAAEDRADAIQIYCEILNMTVFCHRD